MASNFVEGLLVSKRISPDCLSDLESIVSALSNLKLNKRVSSSKNPTPQQIETAKSIQAISYLDKAREFYSFLNLPTFWEVKECFKQQFEYSEDDINYWLQNVHETIVNSLKPKLNDASMILPVQQALLFYSLLGGYSLEDAAKFSKMSDIETASALAEKWKLPMESGRIYPSFEQSYVEWPMEDEVAEIFQKCKEYLTQIRKSDVGLLAEQSFYDEERTLYLMNLITKLATDYKNNLPKEWKDPIIGYDVGAGIPIGAIAMLLAGADKVYAFDNEPENIKLINGLAEYVDFNTKENKRIITIEGNALEWEPSSQEKPDIVYSETFHTGGYREPGVPIIGKFSEYLREGGIIIPDKMFSYVTLVDMDVNALSDRILYDPRDLVSGTTYPDFISDNVEIIDDNGGIEVNINAAVRNNGEAFGVLIETELYAGDFLIPSTDLLNPPFLQEYDNSFHVSKGEEIPLGIKIIYGGTAIQVNL